RLQPDPAEGVRRADAAVRARRPGRLRCRGSEASRSGRPGRGRGRRGRLAIVRERRGRPPPDRPGLTRSRGSVMEVVERGVVSAAVPGTARAFSTFPAFVVLADGSLLITYSIGSGKDTD